MLKSTREESTKVMQLHKGESLLAAGEKPEGVDDWWTRMPVLQPSETFHDVTFTHG